MEFDGEQVANQDGQDGQDERLDEEGIGPVVEGVMELVGLLNGAELDLDPPSRRVELGDLDRVHLLGAGERRWAIACRVMGRSSNWA